MMGRTHVLSGVVVSLASVPLINIAVKTLPPQFSLPTVSGFTIIVMAVAAAGGATLADFDHPNGSVSYALGPLTKAMARFISKITGGHRHGTHTLLAVLFVGLLTGLLGFFGGVAYGVWLAFLFAVGAAALRLLSKAEVLQTLFCMVIGGTLVYFTATRFVPVYAAVYGVMVGYLAHLMGDLLTKQGVPLFMPLTKTRFKVANLTTGQFGETVVVFWFLNVALLGLVAWHLGLIAIVSQLLREHPI